jgi:hypothetical protein
MSKPKESSLGRLFEIADFRWEKRGAYTIEALPLGEIRESLADNCGQLT